MTEQSTPTLLLDAAEAAFGEHGIDNVSLRAIMRAAGANPAAVHYHFGSRQGLAQAVLDRVLEPLQDRRLELLGMALKEHDATLPDLIRCLIQPDLEAARDIDIRNPEGVGLIGAMYCRPSDFTRSLVERSFQPVADRFIPHFQATLPDLDAAELGWRVRWAVFGLLGAILSDPDFRVDDSNLEPALTHITAIMTGALSAPATKEPHD